MACNGMHPAPPRPNRADTTDGANLPQVRVRDRNIPGLTKVFRHIASHGRQSVIIGFS